MNLLTLLLSALPILALPTPSPASSGLRLIKTSPTDPGTWLSEAQKFKLFVSQHKNFVDATETADLESLAAASVRARADFPTSLSHQDEVAALVARATTATIAGWLDTYTAFFNRYYRSATGVEASNWLFATVEGVVAGKAGVSVEQVTHSAFPQKSIIVRIAGQTEDKIVVGAHLDSVGTSTSARAPGADDNASGSFTILETLRVLLDSDYAPTNTVEFHWYAGEEGGLLGSRDIFRSYAAAGAVVKAMLNQDMTGYSPQNTISIITDFTDAGLNDFLGLVAEEYSGLTLVRSQCGYACSDHGSATSSGYPASFLFEAAFGSHSPYIHGARDTVETVDLDHVLGHVRTTIGFAVEAKDI